GRWYDASLAGERRRQEQLVERRIVLGRVLDVERWVFFERGVLDLERGVFHLERWIVDLERRILELLRRVEHELFERRPDDVHGSDAGQPGGPPLCARDRGEGQRLHADGHH